MSLGDCLRVDWSWSFIWGLLWVLSMCRFKVLFILGKFSCIILLNASFVFPLHGLQFRTLFFVCLSCPPVAFSKTLFTFFFISLSFPQLLSHLSSVLLIKFSFEPILPGIPYNFYFISEIISSFSFLPWDQSPLFSFLPIFVCFWVLHLNFCFKVGICILKSLFDNI